MSCIMIYGLDCALNIALNDVWSCELGCSGSMITGRCQEHG